MTTPLWKQIADRTEGWLHPKEGAALFTLARRSTGKGVIVEIGSWKGKSTIFLAAGSQEGAGRMVYAIDPHTGITREKPEGTQSTFEDFQRNIASAKVAALVTPVIMTSADAKRVITEPIELLFIDGSHEEAEVQADFDRWYPQVIDGGVVAFHDTITWEGPMHVARRSLFLSRHFAHTGFAHSLSYGTKVASASSLNRLGNVLMLLRKFLYAQLYRVYMAVRGRA